MDFSVSNPSTVDTQRTDCQVVAVYTSHKLSPAGTAIDEATGGHLSKLLRQSGFDGERGESLLLFNLPGLRAIRLLLVGAGKMEALAPHQFCAVAECAAEASAKSGAGDATSHLAEIEVEARDDAWKIRQLIQAQALQAYRFDELKSSSKRDKAAFKKLRITRQESIATSAASRVVEQADAIAAGIALARDVANRPGNICTPTHLANEAKRLGRQFKSLKVDVLNESDMKKLGMGSLLSVAQGSAEPPRLVTIHHNNGPSKQKPIVLVGKGVTFDTGGISLKPAAGMDEMKFDMGGAASVLGTMFACATLELPLNVIGVIAAVENMPGGKATRPGDIVTSLSGKTIEVLNTDAEGRLILCDAITYSERFKPDVVIDIATLTGACVIALGAHPHGLFSNSSALSEALVNAGNTAHDRAWPMPVWPEYQRQLDSNFADVANIGGREAGAVTAACFLSRFTEELTWAHLDIAGTAWLKGKNKGATGRPVPLLTQFLLDRSQQQPASGAARNKKPRKKKSTG